MSCKKGTPLVTKSGLLTSWQEQLQWNDVRSSLKHFYNLNVFFWGSSMSSVNVNRRTPSFTRKVLIWLIHLSFVQVLQRKTRSLCTWSSQAPWHFPFSLPYLPPPLSTSSLIADDITTFFDEWIREKNSLILPWKHCLTFYLSEKNPKIPISFKVDHLNCSCELFF